MVEAYPLQWPTGYKRTLAGRRTWSRFEQNYDTAQHFLQSELRRLGVSNIVVSTNLRVRKDGLLYTDELNRKIDDPGVAVYFKRKGKDVALCCDKFLKVWENLYAIGKGIEALRAIERYDISGFWIALSLALLHYRLLWSRLTSETGGKYSVYVNKNATGKLSVMPIWQEPRSPILMLVGPKKPFRNYKPPIRRQ